MCTYTHVSVSETKVLAKRLWNSKSRRSLSLSFVPVVLLYAEYLVATVVLVVYRGTDCRRVVLQIKKIYSVV